MRDGNVVLDLARGASIAYTAPERLRGGSGDRRSDVWSLGVMLWEALAHVRLFEGTTDEALRKAVETAEIVPVNEMNANVLAELGAICTKALARDPAGRYQSAKVMAAEISAVLDDAGYPEGTDAIAKWIAKEIPVAAAPAPLSIPPSAAVPAPLQPTPVKLHNQTMTGMTPFGQEIKAPVLPAPKIVDNKTQPLTMMDIVEHRPATPSIIPLDNPIIPLDVKKGSGHGPDKIALDTLPDVVKPTFLDHKPGPGNVTKGWDVVPEPSQPKPEVKAELPKSDSKSSLPSWATRPGGTQPPPIMLVTPAQPITPMVTPAQPITPVVTPAQPIAPAVPFSPSTTLQGISNPAIKPPPIDAPIMKLPDAPPGATVSADKPAAFNTTSIVGSSISNAIPGVPAAFSGNRTAMMGSNAIIDAVNASVSAANPPVAVAAPVLVPAAPILPSRILAAPIVAPVKISEAETVNTPAVTLPPPMAIPKTPDIRSPADDGAKQASSSASSTLEKPTTPNTAVAKLPPPSDDDFAERETSSTGSTKHPRAPSRGDRTSKGDLLAGWGVSTAEHEALRDGDDDHFEADQKKAKKRLVMIMGGAVAAVVLVIVIAFAMSGDKKTEDEPVAKSTTPIGDPTQAGAGQPTEPPKQEPPKQEPVVEPPKQEGSGSATEPPKQEPVPEPAITKVEPVKPEPVVIKPEPKKPDPVIVKKPEPKKPDPVIVKKPDPVVAKPPVDAATAYKSGFQLYVKGDTNGALTSFKEALASNPGYAPTWRGIGLVYEKLGRKSQAVTAFKRYLELSPSAGDADQIRNRLEKLGS